MDGITLLRKISVKEIVTDELKKSLSEEISAAITEIDKNLEYMRSEHSKAGLMGNNENILKAIIAQSNRLLGTKAELEAKKKEVDALSIGGEYLKGVVEGPVNVELGDMFFEKINGAEVVLKDGEVVEIRGKRS